MPKTKRSKLVSLTKTKKKLPEHKELLVKRIKQSLKKFQRVIVFQYENMTTVPFREIQNKWTADSKFFLGKNKVAQVALGKNEEGSSTKNSYLLAKHLKGERGLLFTNKTVDQLQQELSKVNVDEYARVGQLATKTIVLEKGTNPFEKFSFSMEPYLRQLGLNTQLQNQKIVLNENFTLSQLGKELNVEQTKLLRLLELKMAKFQIIPICVLQKNGSFSLVR